MKKILVTLLAFFLVSCGGNSLVVDSFPKEATISITDGQEFEAPKTFESITSDYVTIKARKTGYLPTSVEVQIEPGENKYTINLLKEAHFDEVAKPGMPEDGLRIRSIPHSTSTKLIVYGQSKTGTLDMGETPVFGDWNKIISESKIGVLATKCSGVAILRADKAFGVTTVQIGSDATLQLSNVDFMFKAPNWKYRRLIKEVLQSNREDVEVKSMRDGDSLSINFKGKKLDNYSSSVLFHGSSVGDDAAWTFIDNQGRQSVKILRDGKVKEIWKGEYGLGVFDHLKEQEARVIQLVGNDKLLCALATEKGYRLTLFDLNNNSQLCSIPLKRFPKVVWHAIYDECIDLRCDFEKEVKRSFTYLVDKKAVLEPPDVRNGYLLDADGVWLPVDENRFEIRLLNNPTLSVLVEKRGDWWLVVFAGLR